MWWYIRFLPGWSGAEIKCTVYVAQPKRPMNQFKLDQQSRQHALRAYCSNIYIYSAVATLFPEISTEVLQVTKSRQQIVFGPECKNHMWLRGHKQQKSSACGVFHTFTLFLKFCLQSQQPNQEQIIISLVSETCLMPKQILRSIVQAVLL